MTDETLTLTNMLHHLTSQSPQEREAAAHGIFRRCLAKKIDLRNFTLVAQDPKVQKALDSASADLRAAEDLFDRMDGNLGLKKRLQALEEGQRLHKARKERVEKQKLLLKKARVNLLKARADLAKAKAKAKEAQPELLRAKARMKELHDHAVYYEGVAKTLIPSLEAMAQERHGAEWKAALSALIGLGGASVSYDEWRAAVLPGKSLRVRLRQEDDA